MYKYICFVYFIVVSLCSLANEQNFIEVDFDQSMGIENPSEYHKLYLSKEGKINMEFFRNLYNKNKPSKKKYSPTPIIPKIIHQVWVGGGEIPPIYQY